MFPKVSMEVQLYDTIVGHETIKLQELSAWSREVVYQECSMAIDLLKEILNQNEELIFLFEHR